MLEVGKKTTKPVTTVQECVSTFVSVKLIVTKSDDLIKL